MNLTLMLTVLNEATQQINNYAICTSYNVTYSVHICSKSVLVTQVS